MRNDHDTWFIRSILELYCRDSTELTAFGKEPSSFFCALFVCSWHRSLNSSSPTSKVLIAFGSNVGDSVAAYEFVQQELPRQGFELLAASTPRRTKPIGTDDSQDPYLNAALLTQTTHNPQQAIQHLLKIEQQLGRVRDRRWGPRTVDLDLLLFNDCVIAETELVCPHPRMSFRRFVLEPASEIASAMIHPISGCTIGQLLEQLDSRRRLVLWVGELFGEARTLDESVTPLGQTVQWIDVDSYQKLAEEGSAYAICRIDSLKQFDSLESLARLVVIASADGLPEGLLKRAARFSGAVLRLDFDPSIEIKREVISAIDAMS